ncbi:MAG TPA: HEAT repeat domain-containing protein [Kofleriaceae bacterium]|nr:HEAT repeat domain-containing protein [Kofleriaceae bacterium]
MFGLFSKDRALKRAMEKVTSKHAQSVDRWAAMEKVAKQGSEEALYALCCRFAFKYDKTIEDQSEKSWVVEALVARGENALPAVRRYMKTAGSLHYPLIVLGQIAEDATVFEVIDEILRDEPPGYTRDPERRTDVLSWLGEWEGPSNQEIARRILPYLEDFDENVRYKAVDSLGFKPTPEAAEPLVKALVREEEESRRLRQRIAEVLADNQWDLGERKSEVAALLETQLTSYKMHRDRLVRQGS